MSDHQRYRTGTAARVTWNPSYRSTGRSGLRTETAVLAEQDGQRWWCVSPSARFLDDSPMIQNVEVLWEPEVIRPSEPIGTGAVARDERGRIFVRAHGHSAGCNDWYLDEGGDLEKRNGDAPRRYTWGQFVAVEVLSEGVVV